MNIVRSGLATFDIVELIAPWRATVMQIAQRASVLLSEKLIQNGR